MKLFLLKILLQRRARDEGYVIPVVIALGLIMTLIGTISIFQAGDEEIISISQKESSKALAAAEAGISRYREFIDRYKTIAMYDACNDADNDDEGDNWSGIDCNDSNAVVSWSSTTIPNLGSYCPALDADGNNITVATAVDDMASRGWQNIGEDATQGQFRLIDYTYNPGTFDAASEEYANNAQPTGTLIVEGRVGQDNTSFENEDEASLARIQVQLPVQPGLPNVDGNLSLSPFLNGLNPTLWIVGANDTNINLGDIRVNGNIIISDADCDYGGELPSSNSLFSTDDDKENAIVVDPRNIPIVPDPSTTLPSSVTSINDINEITLDVLRNDSLPRRDDRATDIIRPGVPLDAVYYYKLVDPSPELAPDPDDDVLDSGTDLVLTGGDTINIRNGRKVVLFVEGDINLNATGGDININPDPANNSSHLEIYATDSSSEIEFEGNEQINIKALLHAPESPVTILNDPNVSFIGAMWVEDFTGKNLTNTFNLNFDSNNFAIDEDQYLNYTFVYNDLVDLNVRIADPVVAPPSQWETQQVE